MSLHYARHGVIYFTASFSFNAQYYEKVLLWMSFNLCQVTTKWVMSVIIFFHVQKVKISNLCIIYSNVCVCVCVCVCIYIYTHIYIDNIFDKGKTQSDLFLKAHCSCCLCVCMLSCSVVSDFSRPYGRRQAPLSMGFFRQEYWSGLPLPSPGDLPNPGIKPRFPALPAHSSPSEPPGKPEQFVQLLKDTGDSFLWLI